MFKRTKISTAAMLAIGAIVSTAAVAQDAQRVEITGSSIKRIAAEGALPVITVSRKEIEQSGATSVRDLIQSLPSMQGFTSASNSVNGQGGGTTTASLKNLGEIYTLVLLNGRRIAPFDTGSTVNLENLPLAAIEKVEILTDGASTLYGADAIAGVVNFITRKNTTEGGIDLQASIPQHSGGKGYIFSASKGFGDLDTDRFNFLIGASYEKEDKIAARDREFSKTGVFPFDSNGKKYLFVQSSANANPPNVDVGDLAGTLGAFYNPQLVLNGNCGADPASFAQGSQCRFDYASTVEAKPEAERKNLFMSGRFKINNEIQLFGEAMFGDVSITGRFAPPAQPLSMEIGGTLWNRYVLPTLASQGLNAADIEYADYYMRLSDAGLRANEYRTKSQHLVVGAEGSVFGLDGSVSYTHSSNTQTDNLKGGYSSLNKLNALIDSGQFDPFVQGSAASKAALAPAILNEKASETDSSIDVLALRASRPLFELAGGSAYLGFGADFMRQKYSNEPSPIFVGPGPTYPGFTDFPVGSANGQLPFDAQRDSRGVYAELQMPLMKTLEITGALRYDSFDAAENKRAFDSLSNPVASTEQGNSNSKTTYKLGLRFQPLPEVLLRASIGTGFRMPTLNDISKPLADFGVIGIQRACPVTAGDPLFAGCRPNATQWKLQTGGNPFTGDAGLKPETSDQWNIGIRFEPNTTVSAGLDWWSVKVDNVLTVVPEKTAFDNFENYRSLFSVTTEAATGRPILTYNQVAVNGAVAKSEGIDLDVTLKGGTSFGKLTGQFGASYLIESYFDYGFGGGKESSLGRLGSDDQVAFRTLLRFTGIHEMGGFTNVLSLSWKPGYTDQSYATTDGPPPVIFERNPDGTRGAPVDLNDFRVGSYTLVDWQTKYAINQSFSITGGIKNLFDTEPPRSIKTVAGNMLGFDPRYHDGVGRTFYVRGSYRF
jgi:iron complex outermembrane recepter protein